MHEMGHPSLVGHFPSGQEFCKGHQGCSQKELEHTVTPELGTVPSTQHPALILLTFRLSLMI